MPQKSIRLRLLLWFGGFLSVLIVGFGLAVFHLHKRAWLADVDAGLAQRVDLVSRAFRYGDPHPPPPPMFTPGMDGRGRLPEPHKTGKPPEHHLRSPIQLPAEITRQFGTDEFFAVWGLAENRLLAGSAPAMSGVPRPAAAEEQTLLRHRSRGTLREAYQFTERGDCILAGRDVAPGLARLRLFAWRIAAIGLLVLLAGLGGEFLVSRLLLDSIRRISHTARHISEGNLSERIPTGDMDRELGQLAGVLNGTFARLEAAFARQRQFTADAAHELRTPLAVIISDAQTALRRERSAEEYRDTIAACEAAAQRLRRLSDSLLELARLDAGREQGPRARTDLARIAADVIGQLQPLAQQRNIRIETDLQPALLACHADQIARVFLNLIANALEYNRPEGRIQVQTGTQNGEIVTVVSDTGIGISPEDLPHVFERFYRTAPARARSADHAGLGLAICKAIVDAHGGRIEASSTPGAGTTVTLSWPADPAQG